MKMRTCKKCGETKPITELYKHGDYYATQCKDCAREYSRKWSKEHKEQLLEKQRKYRKENPEKMRAQSLVNSYVQSGKLNKPLKCESCGAEGYVEAHHSDYSKPLDVMWVCKKCHRKLDDKRRERESA